MDKKLTILIGLVAIFLSHPAFAQNSSFWSDIRLDATIAYNIGGTAPVGLPASIRKLNSYSLRANPDIGVNAEKPLGSRWGILIGLHFENKGMKEDANVKNYHIEMVRGGESLEGMFTGDVTTHVREWMLTLPVMASYCICEKVRLHAGPYISWLVGRRFDGVAHDGFLRVGDPTGPRVELGNEEGTRGDYDFTDSMRYMQIGIAAGADWQTGQRWGVSAGVKWGVSGVHHSNFKTIDQTLYPIFGTVGVTYKIK